jgi:2-oxoisovalerate dehydrogenase E1 component alpha subunit
VIAVRHVLERALQRARSGQGPTVVEGLTYRLSDHTTADDASRYRLSKEVEQAWLFDPMKRLRNYLERLGAWDAAREQAYKTECSQQVEAAVQEYFSTPKPQTAAMFDYLFAHMPKRVAEQKQSALQIRSFSAH